MVMIHGYRYLLVWVVIARGMYEFPYLFCVSMLVVEFETIKET